eukprot:snap_masked-scaffold_16-processed-gene-0.30-mRNA-1 protein AED:1.00 eAED:1.00 QI:0/0/0/0/1/1/3/0/83
MNDTRMQVLPPLRGTLFAEEGKRDSYYCTLAVSSIKLAATAKILKRCKFPPIDGSKISFDYNVQVYITLCERPEVEFKLQLRK